MIIRISLDSHFYNSTKKKIKKKPENEIWITMLKICTLNQFKKIPLIKKSVTGYTRIRDFFFSIFNFFVNEKFSKNTHSLQIFHDRSFRFIIILIKRSSFLVLLTHNLRIYLMLTLDFASRWVTMCKLNMQNLVIFLHESTFT